MREFNEEEVNMSQGNKQKSKSTQNSKKTAGKPAGKTQKEPQMPAFLWILIAIVFCVLGYFLIRNMRQEKIATHEDRLAAEMSVKEVASLNPDEWLFLDVREPEEWVSGHIEWATLIPLGQLADRSSQLDKETRIVVICRSGNRSAQARDILLRQGFQFVTSMAGGMNEWIAQGLPTVTGQ